jgi:hypothetical protein
MPAGKNGEFNQISAKTSALALWDTTFISRYGNDPVVALSIFLMDCVT